MNLLRISPLALPLLLAPAASAQFLEPDVEAAHTFTRVGTFGWAGSELRDINDVGFDDLAIGSCLNDGGASTAGHIEIYSGRMGQILRTITGTNAQFQLGFDYVGIGDAGGDGWPDLLASAANRNTVYIIRGVNLCPADLAPPFGVQDFSVVLAFLSAFALQESAANLAEPTGVFDFSDVVAFLGAFSACSP